MGQLPPVPRGRDDLYLFDPLSASDRALVREVMADRRIVDLMHRSWRMTLASGLEHSYMIYRGTKGLYPGALWTGTHTKTNRREFWEFRVSADRAVAHYHTHPGSEPTAAYSDWQDVQRYSISGTIGFLQTRYGFAVGRTEHRAY